VVEAQLAHRREHLGGECLVQLHEVDVLRLQAGALERLPGGRHGTDAHHRGVDAGRGAAHHPRERLAAQLAGALLARHDDAGRAVVDLRGVAGRDGPALAKDRLELGEPLERRVGARALVGVDRDRVALRLGHLDRDDLVVEPARLGGRDRAAVRLER